ncbi:MAG: Ig-like domain-containing protein, partial [bacterium]|nr:Ig-like domain-containing protein [bacterium]
MDLFSIHNHMSERRKKQYRLYFFSGSFLGMFASICLVLVFSLVQAQNTTSTPSSLGAPTISVLSRETGGKGQYLTIEGSNFGSVPGVVTFVARGEAMNADSNFQSGCEKLWWRNSYIIIKVPQSVSLQQYKIKVKRPDGATSNEKAFVVTGASPTPGICGILPDNGPAGTVIKMYGERFGQNKGRVSIGGLIDATIRDDQWTDTIITTTIPPGDLGNGRIRVVNASRTLSNQIPFTAGRCTQQSCGVLSECCGDGSCRSQGMCERKVYACTYSWTFSTGNLGVDIGGSCVKNEDCASGTCGPDKKCIRGQKTVGESCKIDTQCQEGLKCEKGVCTSILKKIGDSCSVHSECLSGKCLYGQCQKGDKPLGDACGRGDECSSGNCYKGKCGQSIACLKVLSIEPTGSALARNTPFVITFNQLVDDASLRGKVSISPAVAGSLTMRTSGSGNSARSEAVFSPSGLLTVGTKYSVKITDSIKALSSDNTLGRCVTPGEGEGGACNAPNSTCSVSRKCLPQCSQNDPPQCATHEKVCKDKTTGGLYCRTECKPGDSQACSSSTSCSASDTCSACAACKDTARCKQQACVLPNSPCSSG